MSLINPYGLSRHAAPKMDRPARYRHAIATLRKNSMERVEVSLEEYNGADLCNIAVKRDSTGSHALNGMKQTARFVSITTRQLPALIAALREAENKARDLGLIAATELERN